ERRFNKSAAVTRGWRNDIASAANRLLSNQRVTNLLERRRLKAAVGSRFMPVGVHWVRNHLFGSYSPLSIFLLFVNILSAGLTTLAGRISINSSQLLNTTGGFRTHGYSRISKCIAYGFLLCSMIGTKGILK